MAKKAYRSGAPKNATPANAVTASTTTNARKETESHRKTREELVRLIKKCPQRVRDEINRRGLSDTQRKSVYRAVQVYKWDRIEKYAKPQYSFFRMEQIWLCFRDGLSDTDIDQILRAARTAKEMAKLRREIAILH